MAQNKGTANPKFSVGDRVTEKNRKGMFLLSNNSLKDFEMQNIDVVKSISRTTPVLHNDV